MIWCIMTYIIAYVKTHTHKKKIHNPLCQTYILGLSTGMADTGITGTSHSIW